MEVDLTEVGDDLDLRKRKKKREIENSLQDLETENAGNGSGRNRFGFGNRFCCGRDKPGVVKLHVGKMRLDFSGWNIILQLDQV